MFGSLVLPHAQSFEVRNGQGGQGPCSWHVCGVLGCPQFGSGRSHGYVQWIWVPQGIGGMSVVRPHRQVISSKEDCKQGGQRPLWSFRSQLPSRNSKSGWIWRVEQRTEAHRCKPQFNSFPQGKSQSCHPLLSTSSSTIAPSFFLPLPLVTLRCISGQHTRLHVCLPQFLKFLQSLLQKNSVSPPNSSCMRSRHGTSRVVPPHRHGIVIGTRQGGQGPRWHDAAHGWSQDGCGREQGAPQVGIASVHERRIGPRRSTCFLPQGQVMTREGSRRQVVSEGGCGWQISLQVCFPHAYAL